MTLPRSGSTGRLSCHTVGKLLQTYLDGELQDARTVLIAEHLDECLRCGLEASRYRWLKAHLAGFAPNPDQRQLDRLRTFADDLANHPA